MKPLLTSLIGSHLVDRLGKFTGDNPLVQMGAASLAMRLVARSLPLGLVLIGAAAAYERFLKSKQHDEKSAAPAKRATAKRKSTRAAPKTAMKPARS